MLRKPVNSTFNGAITYNRCKWVSKVLTSLYLTLQSDEILMNKTTMYPAMCYYIQMLCNMTRLRIKFFFNMTSQKYNILASCDNLD
jgi:hypothetical protein